MACVVEASSTVTSGRTGAGSSAGADSASAISSAGSSTGSSGSLRALDVLGNLFFGGHSTLNLGLHRRDKAGRHTVKLANTGKRTLDILGARFGHSCHVTLGGLGTGLALGIGLTRSVGPAVTVPVVDVCHKWSPFSVSAAIGFSHP